MARKVTIETAAAFLLANPRCACGEEASRVLSDRSVVDVDDGRFAGLVGRCSSCAGDLFDAMMRTNRSICG